MHRLRSVALVVMLASAVAAASASAAPIIDLGPGASGARVAVDPSGTGFLAWSNGGTLNYGRLAQGATSFNASQAFTYPVGEDTSVGDAIVRTPDGRVVIADGRCCQAPTNWKYAYVSTDAGASFAPTAPSDANRVGTGVSGVTEAVFAPANTWGASAERVITVEDGPVTGGGSLQSAPLTGSFASAGFSLHDTGTHSESIALQGSTLVVVYTDQNGVAYWRQYTGSGSLNDPASWTAEQAIGQTGDPAAPGVRDLVRLAAGPSGIYLTYESGQNLDAKSLVVQKFTGSGWSAPVAVTAAGVHGNFAIAEDDAGVVHLAYQTDDGAVHYRYSRDAANTPDAGAGTTFTRPQTLDAIQNTDHSDMRLAVDAAGTGWLTWASGAHSYALQIAPGEPPLPPAPGGGGSTPPRPPAAYTGPTRTFTKAAARGISATLKLPKSCVRAGQKFTVTVGTRVKRKLAHGRNASIAKVTFAIDAHKIKTTKHRPFTLSTTVTGATGSKHTITAKVTLKVHQRHHKTKTLTRTIKGSITTC